MIEIYLGAGKTTLLNYLSGRYLGKNLVSNGKVIINGVDSTKYQNGIS
jgi:ABC-type multidrug transport system ATPase subunit